MKKALTVMAVLATAGAVFALPANPVPYTGGWTQTWDFNNGLQGWTIGYSGAGANTAGSWTNSYGGGSLYLPDGANATYDATAMNLVGYQALGKNRFVLQADIYWAATNYVQGSGIGAARNGDNKGPWVIGNNSQGFGANDKSWFNSTKYKSWGLSGAPNVTTVQLDYGYTDPGYFSARYWTNTGNGLNGGIQAWAEIITTAHNAVVHPSDVFQKLVVGAQFNNSQTPWTQAYVDNVRIALVPEPATLALLALGFVGVIRRRR